MTATILQWFDTAATLFASLIKQKEFMAVVLGFGIAIGATQFVKTIVMLSPGGNGTRYQWRITAVVANALATTILWPSVTGFFFGLLSGMTLVPLAYIYGTRVLFHYVPWLESKLSATPSDD